MKQKIFFVCILTFINIHLAALQEEKIYAIMITGKDSFHEHLARKSVQSFLEQTYPNKHLIIINDGDYQLIDEHDQITEIKIKEKKILGALRNIGLALVPENCIWLQWDDDDWHHPKLMEEQYAYLIKQKADLCLLKEQIQYAFSINCAWKTFDKKGIMGTIMCRKKKDVLYPTVAKQEDYVFFMNYKKKYKITLWINPEFYYVRFIHGHNTWQDSHFNLDKKNPNEWNISPQGQDYLSHVLNIYA